MHKVKVKKSDHEVFQDVKSISTQPDGFRTAQPVTIEEPPSYGVGRIYKQKKN